MPLLRGSSSACVDCNITSCYQRNNGWPRRILEGRIPAKVAACGTNEIFWGDMSIFRDFIDQSTAYVVAIDRSARREITGQLV